MAAKFKKDLIFFLVLAAAAIGLAFLINNLYSRDDISKIQDSLDIDDSDSKIKWNRYTEQNIHLSDGLEITRSGIYHLTGSINDDSVSIKLNKKGEVKLILDNVTIKNSSGPAISCLEGDDLVIELIGENYLSDGENYDSSLGEDVKGVIYSKANLAFYGDGTLNIDAIFSDGIISKDDLKFNGGNYNIIAKDDGIRGKDSVYIIDGKFNIQSTGDAIKSTNETDFGKGFVLIENGEIEINSGDDAIHANRRLIINGGEINIKRAYDGLESQIIIINGGTHHIRAYDDEIDSDGCVYFNSGSVFVNGSIINDDDKPCAFL